MMINMMSRMETKIPSIPCPMIVSAIMIFYSINNRLLS